MKKILEFLYQMNANCNISEELILETYKEILAIKDKEKSNIFISTFFTYLMLKNKNSQLITKLLKISFEQDKFTPFNETIQMDRKYPIISVSGSGKKGIKTINVSTVSTIVAVSLGANVIKPCSVATSSKSGSFDFLEMVGVNTDLDIEDTKELLNKTGFGIFPIEKIVPKFDKVYGDVFYTPNILSYALAALICPLKPDVILYGLSNYDIDICGQVFRDFGIDKYRIVSSEDETRHFMDELNIFGKSYIIDSKNNQRDIYDFGQVLKLPKYNSEDIKQLSNKEKNVKLALDILEGKYWNAYGEIIALNAGNILQLSGIVNTIEEGYYMAKEQIKTGKCVETLKNIVIESKGNIKNLTELLKG